MWGSACSHSSSSCGCHEAPRGSLASAALLLSLTITVCVCVCFINVVLCALCCSEVVEAFVSNSELGPQTAPLLVFTARLSLAACCCSSLLCCTGAC